MRSMMLLSLFVILRLPTFVSTLYRRKRAKCHAGHRFFLFSFEKDGAPCRTALPPQRYEIPCEEPLLARDYFIYVRANNILGPRPQLPRPASPTSSARVPNFRASRPQFLRGSDKNYFQALEINFKSLEIYFRGLEIYFRASEKVLFPAAKNFIPCRGGFYMAGDMICSRVLGLPILCRCLAVSLLRRFFPESDGLASGREAHGSSLSTCRP